MAKMALIQNGVKRSKNSSRRRTAKNSAKAKPARRNGTTKAGAQSFAKKNGMVLISKTALNGRRKKRHGGKQRNGVVTPRSTSMFARNGILGNSKQDARQVGGLLAGMAATKVLARLVNGFASPYAAQVGIAKYSEILSEAAVALFVVPPIARKIGNNADAQHARLGGLAVVGLSGIELIGGGQFLSGINPFNSLPIVMNGSQPLVTPNAVSALVQNTSATPQEKAKIAGAMKALQSGASYTARPQTSNYRGGVNTLSMYD